jgi:mono/diheme cytochrome c family protein
MYFQHTYTRYSSALFSLIIICSASSVIAEVSKSNPKRGADIYRELCLRCHGEKLDGHGPEAQYLKIAPANLQSLSSRLKSDWELFVILSHGVMFTPMHGYRDLLSEQEMKDILSYIRIEAPFKPVT